jgi:uncharacterized protein
VTLARRATTALPLFFVAVTLAAADPAPSGPPKRLLFVTHSGGFIHDSVGVAEEVLKEVGPKHGFAVTCYRFTGDPSDGPRFEKYQADFRARTGFTVGPENCGRVNKDTLKNFDAVLFYTTGSNRKGKEVSPLTPAEVTDLADWVKAGGAFAGTHTATDALFTDPAYGDLIGGYFKGHPPGVRKVRLRVEDPKHPAAAPFADGEVFEDEVYVFRDDVYSRGKLHLILSVAPGTGFDPGAALARSDGDYAVSWCKDHGKGKVFYTSLGHPKATWRNPKFQGHLLGGLKWATGQLPGDAKPSGAVKP